MDDFDFVVGRLLDPFRLEDGATAHVARLDDGVRQLNGWRWGDFTIACGHLTYGKWRNR